MFSAARRASCPWSRTRTSPSAACLLERLCTAFAERRASTLVVDAAERAGLAGEMALIDLGQCVEKLSERVSYLPARGLPIRFVDATGSTHALLDAVAEAAPRSHVVLVHASAPELCRLFSQRRAGSAVGRRAVPDRPRRGPAGERHHAYAAMKLLTQRAGLAVFDMVLGAAPSSPRAERIASQMASCADSFFGAVLRDWARVDPAGDATEPTSLALAGWREPPGRRGERPAGPPPSLRPAAAAGHAFP
jgi:flagellar biosynthesis protein FlhG